jgi:hypothetical protein
MAAPTTESERRFADYLESHGYDFDFEPDYQRHATL